MDTFCGQVSGELDLEMHKAIKLVSTEQLGYFLRITKKVREREREIEGPIYTLSSLFFPLA